MQEDKIDQVKVYQVKLYGNSGYSEKTFENCGRREEQNNQLPVYVEPEPRRDYNYACERAVPRKSSRDCRRVGFKIHVGTLGSREGREKSFS